MGIKIFYLDDEPDLCEIFADTFGSTECRIETCTDPKVAGECITRFQPDLIFFDFRLPQMTGDELALKINPSCPTFLVTGEMSPIAAFPFTKIFSKPYNNDDIQAIIDQYLGSKG